jgi:hypothetical protein
MQQQQLHFNSNCTTTDHVSETTASFLQQQLRSNSSQHLASASFQTTTTAKQLFTPVQHQQYSFNCNCTATVHTFNTGIVPSTTTVRAIATTLQFLQQTLRPKKFSRQLTTANYVQQQLGSNCSPQCNNSIFPSTRNCASTVNTFNTGIFPSTTLRNNCSRLQHATAQQEFRPVQQTQLSLRLYFHLT